MSVQAKTPYHILLFHYYTQCIRSVLRRVEIVQCAHIKRKTLHKKDNTTKTKIQVCCLSLTIAPFLTKQNSHFDLGMAADIHVL